MNQNDRQLAITTCTEHRPTDVDGPIRDKAIRLFNYLKELTELRFDVQRNCGNYEDVIWLAEIPREKECYCAAWDLHKDATFDTWIRVERRKRKRPPLPGSQGAGSHPGLMRGPVPSPGSITRRTTMKRIALVITFAAALAQQPDPEPVQRLQVPVKPRLYIDPRVREVRN